MGYNWYTNFVPFTMDEFEQHLYLYYSNDITPSSRRAMKCNPRSADPVQGNDFLHNAFGRNTVGYHKEFQCWFACQNPQKPIPAYNLYPNWKSYPFLKHILYVFHFELLLVFDLSVDDQTIGFKGRHMYNMIISYHNKGIGLQSNALFDQGYTYAFFLRNEGVPN